MDKIKVLLNSGVDSCEVVGDEVVSTLSDGKKVNTQYVLVAIGRRPNIENSGIEELGIELNRGKIVVNEKQIEKIFKKNIDKYLDKINNIEL